jgi:hypothetical protein
LVEIPLFNLFILVSFSVLLHTPYKNIHIGLDVPHHSRHINRLPPQLIPRGDCILGLIGPFKMILLHDHAYFFSHERGTVKSAIDRLHQIVLVRSDMIDASSSMTSSSSYVLTEGEDFTSGSNNGLSLESSPFELIVIEHILVELCAAYQRRMVLFQPVVSRLLFGLTHGSEKDAMEGLHRLVPIKTGIGNFQVILRVLLSLSSSSSLICYET